MSLRAAPASPEQATRDTAIAYGWTVHGALSSGDAAAPVIGSALLGTPGGMMDAFVFDGMAGQGVQADLFSSFDGRLALAGPDGLMIAENDDFGGLTASQVSATLTQSGHHRVVVGTSPVGVGGDYSLSLRQEVDQASFIAPGESPRQRILPGGSLAGSLLPGDAALLPPGEVRATADFYRDGFTFDGLAGDPVLVALTSDFDAFVYLLRPDGTVQGVNSDNVGPDGAPVREGDLATQRQCQISAILQQSGEHGVVVTSWRPSAMGAYTLTLIGARGAAAAQAPSLGPPSVDAPLELGQTVRGTLAQGDNSVHLDPRPGTLCDGFTFSGVLGQAVEFNLVSRFAGELTITDPAGALVTRLGDRAGQGGVQISTAIRQPGDHRLTVTNLLPGQGGDYVLAMSPGAPPPPARPDQPITLGQTVHGNLAPGDNAALPLDDPRSDEAHLRDGYAFEGRVGQTVQVDLSSSFDGFLTLLGPDVRVLATNDDFATVAAARIVVTLPADGIHRVVVSSAQPGLTGPYTLSLSAPALPPLPGVALSASPQSLELTLPSPM